MVVGGALLTAHDVTKETASARTFYVSDVGMVLFLACLPHGVFYQLECFDGRRKKKRRHERELIWFVNVDILRSFNCSSDRGLHDPRQQGGSLQSAYSVSLSYIIESMRDAVLLCDCLCCLQR